MHAKSDNNVYKAQMCTSFYYSTDKYTGVWRYGSTLKDRLRMYLIQRVFSKQNTFLHYRASQSRGLTRGPSFITRIKPSVKCIVIFESYVYLILYTRLFSKLNLFKFYFTIHLLQQKFPDLQYILN